MSSPVRQMNNRRLPPLPGVIRRGSNHSLRMSAPPRIKQSSDFMVTGSSTTFSRSDRGQLRGRSAMHDRTTSAQDLSPDIVIQYLNDNPEVLDDYVTYYVKPERLHRWVAQRTRARRHPSGNPQVQTEVNASINGDIFTEKKATTSQSKWKNRKWQLLQDLTRDVRRLPSSRSQVLGDLSQCMATAANADGFNFYLIDESSQELHCQRQSGSTHSPRSSSLRIGKVGPGSSLAAYVAYTKDSVRTDDGLGDERFPHGVTCGGDQAQSVLAQPILQGNGNVQGVVELYRNVGNAPFTETDEEVVASIVVWSNLCVEYVEMYNSMTKQRKLNDFLLDVTKSIFQDIVSMDTVIMKIMNYAKKLVNADRAALFLLDSNTKELYARIFDTGTQEHVPQKEIRFPMDKGVAGHVASTGQILNIPDAYMDERFNREVDMQTGYKTKSILCMPIYIRGSIIGVVQMVNKLSGSFTNSDEESFETFGIYCGLALHHAKLYDKINRSEQKYKVALEVLSYHIQCAEDEYSSITESQIPVEVPTITQYHFSPWEVGDNDKPLYVLYMFRELYNSPSSVFGQNVDRVRFDMDDLIRFTLTVRKNYRNVPYHNWTHAFSVAHAMYTVIKTADHQFTPLESLALYVACLCHDLDHRGKTNAFMVKSDSPLAAVYSTSTMEHHHFNQTVTILQTEGHNIFKYLSSAAYKEMLSNIRQCILATDLALFFGNKAKMKEIWDKSKFTWDSKDHRSGVMANCMTACDLCSMYKPWDVQMDLVNVIMEEFWQQGDEEKTQGLTPMPMMDREKQNELPQLEVGFLVGICLPCYELMAQILPETKPMVDGAMKNLKRWQELAEEQKEKPKQIEDTKPVECDQSEEQTDSKVTKQSETSEDSVDKVETETNDENINRKKPTDFKDKGVNPDSSATS